MIESGHGSSGHAANIKRHHNVGGLPKNLKFDLIEPLRDSGMVIAVTSSADADGPSTVPAPVFSRNPGIAFGLGNLLENAVDFAEAAPWEPVEDLLKDVHTP